MIKQRKYCLLLVVLLVGFLPYKTITARNNLVPTAVVNELGWHLEKIHAQEAWEITNGSSEIVVAIIDSGINFSHPELAGAQWINTDEIANNSIDDDGNGYIDDVHGWDFVSINNTQDNIPGPEIDDPIHYHATFIAGLITADINGFGIAGIAPNVTLMDIRVLKDDNYAGTTIEEFGDAISYAVDNGADIISMSLQYYGDNPDYYDDIQYAAANNVTLISITGNTPPNVGGGRNYQSFPGGYAEVISVGATNYFDAKADYSNYGPWTELVAPVGDYDFDVLDHVVNSSYLPGGYAYSVGTSFACPQVSAVVALMKSINETITETEIREILQATAIDLGEEGFDDYFGYGLVNAEGAVKEAQERGSYIIPENPSPTPSLNLTNTTTPGLGISKVFSIIIPTTVLSILVIAVRKTRKS